MKTIKGKLDTSSAEVQFLQLLSDEHFRATSLHPRPYNSCHEALGVLEEELDEFKAEIFRKRQDRNYDAILNELVHIASVCMRAGIELVIKKGALKEGVKDELDFEPLDIKCDHSNARSKDRTCPDCGKHLIRFEKIDTQNQEGSGE